ncbi:hypothetical protein A1L58_18120 [Shewanella baltica]|uniref:S8 family serine peptidase n=1 Tax=Shewanella baltica TaxID=62322 RepID=UPI0007B4CB57|nr:S8 family serine peptidase [Shewanella baltica]KZK68670.1 hypothetical protein A1L58_18120 [Shewanella baltica]
MNKNLLIVIAGLLSLPAQGALEEHNISSYAFQDNINNSDLYYEVKSKQYLSDVNEFNTSSNELEYVEITPYWIKQIGLDEIPQPKENIIDVCIIDSGVQTSHPDLQQSSFNGYESNYSGEWNKDSVGHGTHVAGIISAIKNNKGVTGAIDNELINIHVEKLVNTSNAHHSKISDLALINAIESCAGNGAKIINMSLSGDFYSKDLRDVIDRFTYENDIVFVAAAGNHGSGTGYDSPAFPAAYRNVISVGAVNINGELADFSPVYDGVTFVAPGVDIVSTVNHEKVVVEDIFFEAENGIYSFEYSQLDKGDVEYPSHLPSESSCYYELPLDIVYEQIKKRELSYHSKESINEALEICKANDGKAFVITYDFLSVVDKAEFEGYNTWLYGLDINVTLPTILLPGLSKEEIHFFKEGLVKVKSLKNSYLPLTGTSQSAAIMAAGLAKLWSNFPDATRLEVLESLENTTNKLKYEYPSNSYGYGLVDFGAAYHYLLNYDRVSEPAVCPKIWYENQYYNQGETVTFNGIIYKASYDSIDEVPIIDENQKLAWTKIEDCKNSESINNFKPTDFYQNYILNAIERIGIHYKCASYSLSCGGGSGFGGFGGFGFGGSGYSGGGEVGGGGAASSKGNDKDDVEKKKQEEYEDIKKRSENTPPQRNGETNEDYNKRLAKYYDKLAKDYHEWDNKYQPGRHDKKIQDIKNRSEKYQKTADNLRQHREAKDRYKNGNRDRGTDTICKKSKGIVKLACLAKDIL